jgi:hypothetical protein
MQYIQYTYLYWYTHTVNVLNDFHALRSRALLAGGREFSIVESILRFCCYPTVCQSLAC